MNFLIGNLTYKDDSAMLGSPNRIFSLLETISRNEELHLRANMLKLLFWEKTIHHPKRRNRKECHTAKNKPVEVKTHSSSAKSFLILK
jgi:hypothetical protein